jgi:6-phosphogluconolactonase (cycloisomerase 2 family)
VIVSEAFGGAADASAVSSYAVTGRGLDVVSPSVPTTETAACWIATTGDGRFAYAGNAGTNSVTGYGVARDGSLTRLTADGRTGSAPAGVTDLAVSRDSGYLYARLGNGEVGGWAIEPDGTLVSLGTTAGLPAGAAGIAAL